MLDHITTYDADGKKIEEIEYNSEGQKWRKRFEYAPGAEGKCIKESVYNERNRLETSLGEAVIIELKQDGRDGGRGGRMERATPRQLLPHGNLEDATKNADKYTDEKFLGYHHAYINRLRAQLGVTVKFNKHHELEFYLLGDRYKDKEVDTNREGSDSWKENGLVLKSIEWCTGNLISAGVGYKWSF